MVGQGGVELVEVGFEVVVGTAGIAAVAVFDPLGTNKEAPHLAVVGTLCQVAHQVDELVGVAVLPVPLDRRNLVGTQTTRETVGKELLGGSGCVNIARLRKVVHQLHKRPDSLLDDFGMQTQELLGVARFVLE